MAGIREPRMVHPCAPDTGSPCRYGALFKESDKWQDRHRYRSMGFVSSARC